MASTHLAKTGIRNLKIVTTLHMDRHGADGRNHSNENINPELSPGNFYVGCNSYAEAVDNAEKRLKEVDAVLPPKRLKKDRVEALMVNIPCPLEITEQGRTKEFFDKVNDCMKDYFGEKNWHGMEVHVDEVHQYYDPKLHKECTSLVHAHGVATPYVEGKGVNCKSFMTKANLAKATKVVDEMCLREFGISFRTYRDPQHKSVEELKSETNIARNELQRVVDTQNKMIDENRNTIVKQNDKIVENQMEMTELDTALQDMRSENRSLQNENEILRTENECLRNALSSKTKDFENVKSNYSQYFNETKKLKGKINELLKAQEMELGNLDKLTKDNADLKNYIVNEQNRIHNVTDELELEDADDFDYER